MSPRDKRTRSSNSIGRFDRKIAISPAPNSSTVDSCNFDCPDRRDDTRTGIRTTESVGKNLASCSAHPVSSAMTGMYPGYSHQDQYEASRSLAQQRDTPSRQGAMSQR